MSAEVLLSMDDLETAVPLNAALEAAGFSTVLVSAMDDLQAAVRRATPDLVILTGAVHDPPALRLAALARDQEILTLAMLESTDSLRGERGSRLGVTEMLVKPVAAADVVPTARRLVERRRLQVHTGISGQAPAIQEVLVKLEQMAPVSSTVLIQGESGTGKELVAKALHDLSPRRGKPFIAVNCSALPEALLESELFGHEKGSFIGAAERRLGRFELADTGTIFLDEIGEIPQSTQVKLLRVLESRSFFRVGGTQPIKVDVRVVAATNRSLKDAAATGEFREDLFYRLNVLTIALPPLRERREDIPLLVRRFTREFSVEHERPFRGITAEAMRRLVSAPWPGNIRQLRNLVESMVVLAPGTEIRASDIPADIFEGAPVLLPMVLGHGVGGRDAEAQQLEFILRSILDLRHQVEDLRRRVEESGTQVQVIEMTEPAVHGLGVEREPDAVLYRRGMTMAEVEQATIEAALREVRGNRRLAAQALGIGERTLYRKIKEFGLA
ncbi:MAG: sigma-54 dependent transcriptional regulator [Gemmatimonadota bacterium]